MMSSEPPFVSVVVPTYNRRELVRRTLETLTKQTYPATQFEVCLCDDGSTDGTREMVRSLSLPYRLSYLQQANHGRCAARNMGAISARGELVLFLDDDSLATPNLIREHVEAYKGRDRIFVRGERQIHPDLAKSSLFARLFIGELELYPRTVCDSDGFLPPTHAHTANQSIWRTDLVRVGFLDTTFDQGKSWDDADLGYRLAQTGRKLLYQPTALVYDIGTIIDVRGYCARMQQAGRDAWRLLEKHPNLQFELPSLREVADPGLTVDGPLDFLRRNLRELAATGMARKILLRLANMAEVLRIPNSVTRVLYRACVSAHFCAGFRECESNRRMRRLDSETSRIPT